jgi:hypothetical protein
MDAEKKGGQVEVMTPEAGLLEAAGALFASLGDAQKAQADSQVKIAAIQAQDAEKSRASRLELTRTVLEYQKEGEIRAARQEHTIIICACALFIGLVLAGTVKDNMALIWAGVSGFGSFFGGFGLGVKGRRPPQNPAGNQPPG